jgi:hypothetical protein
VTANCNLAVDAGKLGAVAGHAAHLGGHVEPHPGPARRSLLREADDPDQQADARGPGRHPQELGPQGHLHLPPQFRVENIFSRRGGPRVLSPRGSQMGLDTVIFRPILFLCSGLVPILVCVVAGDA